MKKWLPVFLMAMVEFSFAAKMDFIDNDWDRARAEAKAQNKYLFMDAYTDWCGWCKVMDKKTFSQDSVAEFMNKNFVLLKLEMEHNYGIKVAMKYRVSGFPSYLVFNPEGKLVYRFVGYNEAGPFMQKIKEALDPQKQKSYPGLSDKIELDFPEMYLKAYAGNGKRVFPDSTALLNYFDKEKDLFSEVNFAVLARFASSLPSKYELFLLQNQDQYAALYGKDELEDMVTAFASDKLIKAEKDSSETKLHAALAFIDKYVRNEKEDLKTFYQIHFHKAVGNWKKFADQVDIYLSKKGFDNDNTINGWAWEVYEKASDKEVVEKAVNWMKPVIETKPQYFTMDTYAALLFKAGKLKEAENYAQKAIDLGKAGGEKTEETEKLLEKIKKGI